MLKRPKLFAGKKLNLKVRHGSNLERHFILRVLAPPFFILLILGIIIFWQLDKLVRKQAIDELKRASSTTAVKLEREFAIRQTVLQRTGEDLFVIKNSYLASRQTLDKNRLDCSSYIKLKRNFIGAPGSACDPFLTEFAKLSGSSLQAVENGYATKIEELTKIQNDNINDRLSAYKQFFPETIALMVFNEKQQLVSSALSESFEGSTKSLLSIAEAAQNKTIEGKIIKTDSLRLGVFVYPISSGSVLAAYDIASESFVRQSWQSTPIDTNKSLALILDSEGQPSYPVLAFSNNLTTASTILRQKPYVDIGLKGIPHIAVGSEVGKSKWLVVVASPSVAVLAPLRDAQLIAALVIGVLLIGFLWVGAFFIQRTLHSILGLVNGALVFSSGKLDHKIQLQKADAEFVALADTMNTMAERIAAAEKEIDEKNKEFISVATHELRTPLTAIIGNLSMVYEDFGDRLDGTVKPLVEQVYKSTTRLRDLVNDMLDVARLEGGRTEFTIMPIDIKEVASEVINNLLITTKDSGIGLTYSELNATAVLADEARLRIILNNFVSNAIKYNRPKGTVSVAHTLKENMLVTSIKDTGLGIPEDQKEHMFEKFFRVQNADRKNVVGTGLGMYITKQYINAMGGELWFESLHGQGTTFYFSLPLAPNESVAK